MSSQILVESTWGTVHLSSAQAEILEDLGRRLASDRGWWGSGTDDGAPSSTVIRCEHVAGDEYRVRVTDAIGAIGLGGVSQLIVQPKIPLNHLVFLLQQAEQLPRIAEQQTHLQGGDSFHDLVARWFLLAVEQLLRRGLLSDYADQVDELRAARGRVQILPTTHAVLAGRPVFHCEFDEFSNDTPLNRILHAAVGMTARSTVLSPHLRRRAGLLHSRLEPVSSHSASDLRSVLDRRSAYYSDAITLARCIISGNAGTLGVGRLAAGTFLFRTPEAVEQGIRQVLASELDGICRVRKAGLEIAGSTRRTLNPDLVFGDNDAVGDVKYTLLTNGLSRSHIYQLTTFATGYRTTQALLVGFGDPANTDHALVGDVRIEGLNWDVREDDPSTAATTLGTSAKAWYQLRMGHPNCGADNLPRFVQPDCAPGM